MIPPNLTSTSGANFPFSSSQAISPLLGGKGSPFHVDLANYAPNNSDPNPTTNYSSNARIDQFRNLSPIEKELKKTVESTQQMVITYIKGRVPLGDDKFNATDMFRSILDILKAMENVQMVKMMEDSNRIALNNLFLQMPQQVGSRALVGGNSMYFDGGEINFAIYVPESANLVQVSLVDAQGEEVRSWILDEPGLAPITWNGLDTEGKVKQKGTYTVKANYETADGQELSLPIYVTRNIDEVRFDPVKNGGYPEFYSGQEPIQNILAIYDKKSSSHAAQNPILANTTKQTDALDDKAV